MELNGKRYMELMKIHEERTIVVFIRPYMGFDGVFGKVYATPTEGRTIGLENARLIKFYSHANVDEIGTVSTHELSSINIPRKNVAFEIQDNVYFRAIAELVKKI